jgi:hypothetical protein
MNRTEPDLADRHDAEAGDPLATVHKALRRFMFDTLVRVGALDVTDRLDLERTVNLVQRLLGVLGEAAPEIQSTLLALRHGGASQRRAHAAQLYRELSLRVTAQLLRIERLEAERAERLAGAALRQWRRAQFGKLGDDELQDALHWMGLALNPSELASLLDDLRASGAAARFDTALATLERQVEPARWAGVLHTLAAGATRTAESPLALAA